MRSNILNINVLRYPKTICFIILFAWISFFPQPIQDKYSTALRMFLGIFLLVLVLDKKYRKHLFVFQDWPLWLFLISLSSGAVLAQNKEVALKTYFQLFLTMFLLFYIGKAILSSNKDVGWVNIVICVFSLLVALIGVLELYFGKNILYENFIDNPFYERYVRYYPRPMSTQLNPAILGSFLLGCLPFSLYLIGSKRLSLRLLGFSSSLLCTGIIILSFSRGVFLGLIALVLFYLWRMRKTKLVSGLIFCLILLMLVCSFQKNPNLNRFGFQRSISGSYDSIFSEYRFNRVKMAFKIFKEHPLFGIGFNHFRIRFDEYAIWEDKGKTPYEFMIPDNMYLTFLAETGIIGTSGFLIFIYFLLKRGLGNLKELKDEKKQMLLVSMSALLGLLVNMGAYELFYWANPYMLFCLICGFLQRLTLS